jgi:ABC-type branched-subunit amino acid transport system substrate-binding protein
MRTFKFVNVLFVVALLLSVLSGCGSSKKELKIAILAPLSGPVPTFGIGTRDGALLAIDEWNAKGGVLGRTIVPIVEDSQCTPDPAVNAANKVIDQDKVHYIVGEVCSSASIPVSEVVNKKKVVQISPTSTNPKVVRFEDGTVKPFTFVACFNDDTQGKAIAEFSMDTLKAKTAFIMYDQANDYVKGLAEYFEKYFTAAGGYFTNHYSPYEERPIVVNFVKKYGDKYKNADGTPVLPDALAALAYDATNMLLQAIKDAGKDDATKVAEALAKGKFDVVSGEVTFDAFHTPIKPVTVVEVREDRPYFLTKFIP